MSDGLGRVSLTEDEYGNAPLISTSRKEFSELSLYLSSQRRFRFLQLHQTIIHRGGRRD